MKHLVFLTDWGWIGVAATDSGLRRLVLPHPRPDEVEQALSYSAGALTSYNHHCERSEAIPFEPYLHDIASRLKLYLKGHPVSFPERVDLSGATCFQQEVWLALRNIPYGKTISYSELAKRLGRPEAARAVGQALSKNPLPIILPCHRVTGKNGNLVGFSGGTGLKRALLKLEAGNGILAQDTC